MAANKVVDAAAARPKPPAAGKGRQKGVPNKLTKQLKDMILGALDDAGGQEYLATQAVKNPAAFMTLIGKVLPLQVVGGGPDDPAVQHAITVRFVKPES